jgi:asparagine synthetase B (glutamine-hydrolysing)
MLPGLIDGLACWDAGTLAIQAPLAHVARRLAGRFDLLLTGYGADLLFAGVVDPDLAGRAAECSLADELATALTGPDTAPWPPIAPGPVLRHPYLSAAMVRAALALPMTAKRRGGAVKHCLRHAVDGLLPAEVAWRRKSGVHEGSRMDLLMADALGPGDDASWTGLLEARARAVLGVA